MAKQATRFILRAVNAMAALILPKTSPGSSCNSKADIAAETRVAIVYCKAYIIEDRMDNSSFAADAYTRAGAWKAGIVLIQVDSINSITAVVDSP